MAYLKLKTNIPAKATFLRDDCTFKKSDKEGYSDQHCFYVDVQQSENYPGGAQSWYVSEFLSDLISQHGCGKDAVVEVLKGEDRGKTAWTITLLTSPSKQGFTLKDFDGNEIMGPGTATIDCAASAAKPAASTTSKPAPQPAIRGDVTLDDIVDHWFTLFDRVAEELRGREINVAENFAAVKEISTHLSIMSGPGHAGYGLIGKASPNGKPEAKEEASEEKLSELRTWIRNKPSADMFAALEQARSKLTGNSLNSILSAGYSRWLVLAQDHDTVKEILDLIQNDSGIQDNGLLRAEASNRAAEFAPAEEPSQWEIDDAAHGETEYGPSDDIPF